MDDHPEFLESYIFKRTKQIEENYVRKRAISDISIKKLSSGSFRRVSITPSRKISVSSLSGCSVSELISPFEDASSAFLSPIAGPRRKSTIITEIKNHKNLKKETTETNLNEICFTELNIEKLSFSIAKHLCTIFRAVSVTTLLVGRQEDQLVFSVAAGNVERNSDYDISFTKHLGFSMGNLEWFTLLVNKNEFVNIKKEDIAEKIGPIPFIKKDFENLLILPLQDDDNLVQALEFIFIGDSEPKKSKDSLGNLPRMYGKCLRNAVDFQSMRLDVLRWKVFVDLTRIIFDQETSIGLTVLKILANMIILTDCQFAQLVLTDTDSFNMKEVVFDLHVDDQVNEEFDHLCSPFENRFHVQSGIINIVAAVGETVNIVDMSDTNTFNSLLCVPLKNNINDIIGIVTLNNKKTGRFTKDDEVFVEAFGLFCGIALENVGNLEAAKVAEARCQIAFEVLSYHANVSDEEFNSVVNLDTPTASTLQLLSLDFTEDQLEDLETIQERCRKF